MFSISYFSPLFSHKYSNIFLNNCQYLKASFCLYIKNFLLKIKCFVSFIYLLVIVNNASAGILRRNIKIRQNQLFLLQLKSDLDGIYRDKTA